MIMSGLVRIGNEPALRHTPKGEAVIDLSLAYPYGRGDQSGKRPTQWIKATLWGKRAESLAPYLLKGKQYCVVLNDVYLHQFEKKDGGIGYEIRAKIDSLEFTDRKDTVDTPREDVQQRTVTFNDIDDDVPF